MGHAAWNLVAKGAQGGAAFVWLTAVGRLYAPVLVGGIDLAPAAIALMAGSGALHAAYFVLLQRGYATGDLSLARRRDAAAPVRPAHRVAIAG